MSSNTSTQPRIAIIGAGLGGLALLLTLHRRGIPATVYERDTSFDARAHLGGSLDLGWKSGQRALRENGLQDAFDKHSRPEGEEMRICDSTGKVYLKLGGDGEEGPGGPPQGKEDIRPEIDRTVLRKLLLDAVPADLVQWDHALSSVRALGNGQHELTFANGTTTTCDLLVGADGAHSRVRPLLSPATPQFLGVNGAEISLAPSTTKLPALAETIANVGQGTMMAMSDSRMLGAQVNGDGRIRTYSFLRALESWSLRPRYRQGRPQGGVRGVGGVAGQPDLLLRRERDIPPRAVISARGTQVGARSRGDTPWGRGAPHESVRGAGANLALLDGLELGLALAGLKEEGALGDVGAVSEAVKAFEENIISKSGKVSCQIAP